MLCEVLTTFRVVKTCELNADVLIAAVIKNIQFRKMNVLYPHILYGDLYGDFACSFALQIS